MELKEIKKQITHNLKRDYPDTDINIKWSGLKNTKFPSGLSGQYLFAEVSGKGYNTRKYTLTITNNGWSFR